MFELNLPPFDKKIIDDGEKSRIFDILRKRYVALTPEEWVRQHFVHFLIEHKDYPAPLMGNEVRLNLHGMSRRCDTVVYDRSLTPRLIVEYKAPTVPITQKVFDQISRYNIVMQVQWLIVTNGLTHYCCHVDYEAQCYSFVPDIPVWEQIIG